MASSATNYGSVSERPPTPFVGHRWSSVPDNSDQDNVSAAHSGEVTPANSVAEPLCIGYDTDEETQELQTVMGKLIIEEPKYPQVCIIWVDIVNDERFPFSVTISGQEKVATTSIDQDAARYFLRGNGNERVCFCVNGFKSETYWLSALRGQSVKIKVYQTGVHLTMSPCRSFTPPPIKV